jgi:hypothetical protein
MKAKQARDDAFQAVCGQMLGQMDDGHETLAHLGQK